MDKCIKQAHRTKSHAVNVSAACKTISIRDVWWWRKTVLSHLQHCSVSRSKSTVDNCL